VNKSTTPSDEKGIAKDNFESLISRASKGDTSTLPRIRELLLHNEMIGILGGDMVRNTENTLIGAAAGKDLMVREALKRKLAVMRDELAGPTPTPLDKLLIDRIVLSWLALHDTEARFAQMTGLSIAQADYWQRRIDHCHRRYLSAIKALASIRKLALPALQMNFARKQVNIVGGAAAEAK
jgi:hypothetical protein